MTFRLEELDQRGNVVRLLCEPEGRDAYDAMRVGIGEKHFSRMIDAGTFLFIFPSLAFGCYTIVNTLPSGKLSTKLLAFRCTKKEE